MRDLRDLRQGRQSQGGDPVGRDSVRGPAREYPNPPTQPDYAGALFAKAAGQRGHTPFQMPSVTITRPYTNFAGVSMQACTVCGSCDRFGREYLAKASPQTTLLPKALSYPTVELRPRVLVTRGLLDRER
ncbi:MAG TPA: hypothetical protein VHN13_15650 [Candidatus Tectomicrobia bacterium]|nr:hypothetical protein [Candidatus Tectomicrobia bacterium]